jgi:hypothetical protein
MSKDATLAQGIKAMEALNELTCAQFQSLSGSGILADVVEAAKTIGDLNARRDAVRVALGLDLAVSEPEPPKPPPMSITLDTDVTPFIPSGLSLQGKGAEHRGMGRVTLEKRADGQLYVNGRKVERYLSPNQKDGNTIQGYELAKELKDEPTLNACILDALYENQQLIPDGWENGLTYFWATKFRLADGDVFVEYLYRYDGRWYRHYYWLAYDWYGSKPAARLAQN